MELVLDGGNSRLSGALFEKGEIRFTFHRENGGPLNAERGRIFLEELLRGNQIPPRAVRSVGCASVVPSLNGVLKKVSLDLFGIKPFFVTAAVTRGLRIAVENPDRLGADRIAAAVGAVEAFPGRPLLIADFGTATTLDGVDEGGSFLGGMIFPGMRTALRSLEKGTAQLSGGGIAPPRSFCGKNTEEALRSGLYLMQVGALREGIDRFRRECFQGEKPLVIATGGFAPILTDCGLFDHPMPDLVLRGIYRAEKLYRSESSCLWSY
ncbi:MAG: type III pantothenate kinase [Spirochaetales bacterium]|nr:type III pantothenate kinase [Spirochaetales bacterium]